ncbi:MAG: DUF5666 domain-containing protein [Candidatus Paceibacterota bacterium]|jgi:hypothetical protein
MKKLLLVLLTVPSFAFAQVDTTTPTQISILQNIVGTDRRPEITVTRDGAMTLRNVKIAQFAGTTFFARLVWGDMFLRVTIKTNGDTKFYRRYGEATTLKELKEGDYLNIDGTLEANGNTFTMAARNVVDLMVLKETSAFSGNIGAVMADQNAFTLYSTKYGPVRVNVGSAPIYKGTLTITTPWLQAGDKVISVSGEYNHADNSLAATAVNVFIDLKQFEPRNYSGKILSITNQSKIRAVLDRKEYDVVLDGNTKLLNKNRSTISFKRFVEGDEIRLYGATSEAATTTITAEVIRNLSL